MYWACSVYVEDCNRVVNHSNRTVNHSDTMTLKNCENCKNHPKNYLKFLNSQYFLWGYSQTPIKSVADSERHCLFLVLVTKMYSDGHHLPQISLSFHQVFFTVYICCIVSKAFIIKVIPSIWLALLLCMVWCHYMWPGLTKRDL